MKKGKEKEIEFGSKKEIINVKEFLLLNSKKQDELVREILDKMYNGNVSITQKHIDKVLNVAFDTKDTEVYLPHSLYVDKQGNDLIFIFQKKNNLGLLILFLLAFLFIGGFATYTGVQFLAKEQLNIDLDGDGIADLNIDLHNNGVCDVNCDTNKDKKPDRNIDYHSGRKPIFNVILENDEIFNPVNQMKDGKCYLNCDTNDDGWPDLNVDYDGDGVPDLDRDIDGDGIKDLDIDFNGDGVCDINCDTNKDNKCDQNCTNVNIEDNGGGTSSSNGDGGIGIETASLIVSFEQTNSINATDIYPDDHTEGDVNTKIPDLLFTVENTTNKILFYDISWYDIYNTFESNNFWYQINSYDEGFKQEWTSTPKADGILATRVAISPRTKQHYNISFTLHGTGSEQNYDQGKVFKGKIKVELDDVQ